MTCAGGRATSPTPTMHGPRSNLHLLGELAMRYQVETQTERATGDLPSINCPDDVRRLLGPEMSRLAQEQLRVLLLNTKNNVVGQRVVYQGNVNSSMIRPAEVLRPAVMEAVPSIIVCLSAVAYVMGQGSLSHRPRRRCALSNSVPEGGP